MNVSPLTIVVVLCFVLLACRREEGPEPRWQSANGPVPGADPGGYPGPVPPAPPPLGPAPESGGPQLVPPRAPQPAPRPTGPRADWAAANLDPNDDFTTGPPAEMPDCIARLTALGVRAHASSQPVHQEGKNTCGAPQVLIYERGPAGVRWSSPPQVTCLVALGLSRFEQIAQEEAKAAFSSGIKRIDHMGTYSCRPMVRFNLASEHSFANAIDVGGFELENGTRISVDPHWGPMDAPPQSPAAKFLRAIARRTYDEGAFSVVLGPPWDALHKNHLHLDQARYRVDGLIVRAK